MYSTSEVCVDLNAIAQNYNLLKSIASNVAPVVKANSYGIGSIKVVNKLIQEGAKVFFVATIDEALELREFHRDITIFCLLGLYEDPSIYSHYKIIPIINSYAQFKDAIVFGRNEFAVGFQFDTGMSRNGMGYDEINQVLKSFNSNDISLKLIMSHLASSEEKNNNFNNLQLTKFKEFSQNFYNIPKSFANSSGIFLGKDYHFDLVRPGIGLYGYVNEDQIIASVKMKAKILEIHAHKAGETVGYNQTFKLDNDKILATIGIGYADGISRALSNVGKVYYHGRALPILGRVSMDTIIVDITDCADKIKDLYVTIFETKEQMFEIAKMSNTIPYEILTSIGKRSNFRYESSI